ncbi:20347_t:CDS:2, partial [Gigaspora rosea]
MSNKSPQELTINIEDGKNGDVKDGDVKELYLATSPIGDFVVEFEQDEYPDLKARKATSCRNLSEIDTSKQKPFKFTTTQSDLITSEDKLS